MFAVCCVLHGAGGGGQLQGGFQGAGWRCAFAFGFGCGGGVASERARVWGMTSVTSVTTILGQIQHECASLTPRVGRGSSGRAVWAGKLFSAPSRKKNQMGNAARPENVRRVVFAEEMVNCEILNPQGGGGL